MSRTAGAGSKNSTIDSNVSFTTTKSWKAAVEAHKEPVLRRGLWQVANTVLPYIALWGLTIWLSTISYWLAIPTIILAAAFMVRIFIIFHDCTHGSFFASRRANDLLGFITGALVFTPFQQWKQQHALHHGTSGDLDRRGTGDIWTLTVEEYLNSSRWKRFSYRLSRNPIILFIIAPLFVFLIQQRFPCSKVRKNARVGVHWTNLALLIFIVTMSLLFGFQKFLVIQVSILALASAAGVWLFYVQHQFEGVYWEREEEWDYVQAALQGSSFYKLPRILQWFSGNIGFHHLHHLSPQVPNYNLERCHDAHEVFRSVKPITLLSSFKSLTYRLWDEERRRLVGFGELRAIRKARQMERAA